MLSDHHYHWWKKIVFYLLILHGIYGTWEAVKFIFIEYPKLNDHFEQHLITAQELNEVVIDAFILVLVTILSIILASRLKSVNRDISNTIDLLAGTFLLLAGSFLSSYLLQFNIFDTFSAWISSLLLN